MSARHCGSSNYGRVFHVLAEAKPAGASHRDPFWDYRTVKMLCGRVLTVAPVGDRYADGTPLPICRACARAEARR